MWYSSTLIILSLAKRISSYLVLELCSWANQMDRHHQVIAVIFSLPFYKQEYRCETSLNSMCTPPSVNGDQPHFYAFIKFNVSTLLSVAIAWHALQYNWTSWEAWTLLFKMFLRDVFNVYQSTLARYTIGRTLSYMHLCFNSTIYANCIASFVSLIWKTSQDKTYGGYQTLE